MLPGPSAPIDDAVLRETEQWLERAVIGLSLCPFARSVHAKGQIRYAVSAAKNADEVLLDLRRELTALSEAEPDVVDTALLILPHVFAEFFEYNAFLARADAELERLGLVGQIQIASFHPDYRFGDLEPDDVANASNRSPYPLLHLLREASVARAVAAAPDAARIFEKNVATLRALGHAGLSRVLAGAASGAPPSPEPAPPTAAEAAALSFAELLPGSPLLAVIAELGFEMPTRVQSRCIPALLAGSDLVGQSKTGSGKTAAFALPLLEKVELGERALQGIILCPTRELSAQVARELRKLGRGRPGLVIAVLSGGEPVRDQTRILEKGVHLVVGTPGRVIDHLERRTLRVHRVATIVLDEADRMLDMGFQPDIEKVLKALPPNRQTVLFSATFPPSIGELSGKYQRTPTWVTVQEEVEAAPDILERVVDATEHQKLATLGRVLAHHAPETALVFANQKIRVAQIEKALSDEGLSVASLHGDLEQRDRDRVMAKFRNGSTRVLVATDVAARGIDLDKLDLVVNFDLPSQPEIYVHRIGRTGRAGQSGIAVSLRAPGDEGKVSAIEAYTGRALERARDDEGKAHAAASAASSLKRASMVTLRLSGGRKDKLRPGDILGALTGEAGGLAGDQIGKIEIHERFSFVALATSVSDKALASLRSGRIKGKRFRVDRVE